ncbi:hypothetical protein BSKO_05653 [Bryopsis sp. KO-2023]|nr:hypothetical protein BSKO_05653 [Bryopsis sp. KO-2023]
MDMEIDMVSPLASSFGHPLDSTKPEGSKVPKRKKGGKAGRASFTLKLPKFEDASSKAEFMMYTFKVALCTRRRRHTWSGCPYAHPGETARRRDPRTHCAVPCPEMKQGQKCPRGDRCPYSHHDFEYWLHPTRYRTVACNKSGECGRALCFFYHGAEEQRTTSSQTEKEGSPMLPTTMEDPHEHPVQQKVGMGGDNPHMHCLMMDEGVNSDDGDGEGDSVDSLMGSLLSRHSFKSNSFNSSRTFTKSHSFTSSFSSPSQTSGTPRQVAPGEHLRSSSMRARMPVNEKLASMQIQTLLANAVKLQSSGSVVGRGSPGSMQGPGASCPSIRSYGSASPTSTHASAMGGMSDEMMDSAGGGVAWGPATTSSIATKDNAAQMSEFLFRRQSAPVVGMTYEALQCLGSNNGLGPQGLAEERDAAMLQGLLMSRGSTPAHPNWALNSARSTHLSPRNPLDGATQQITGVPASTFGIHTDFSQTGFVNNGGIGADQQHQQNLSSPFVTGSSVYDMVGQTRLTPCWEIAQPQIQVPQLDAWDGPLNSSFSADFGGGRSTWGAVPLPTASSCIFPGVLGMEGQ